MTVEVLQNLSLASYIVAALFFLTGVALFFLFDIPALYGDLSGRTARKAIAKIQKQNESGAKVQRTVAPKNTSTRLTDKITDSGRLESRTEGLSAKIDTAKFPTGDLQPTGNETTVLGAGNETTVLGGGNETTVLSQQRGETTVLTAQLPDQNETTVLDQNAYVKATAGHTGEMPESPEMSMEDIRALHPEFSVEVEISFTGSSEIIE